MEKDFSLAILVPGIWIASVLVVLLETIAAPFVFIYALFLPESLDDIMEDIMSGLPDFFQ